VTARVTYPAELDIDDAAAWLESINPGSGQQFAAAAQQMVNRLCATPRLYERVRRSPRGREVRQGLIPGGSNFVMTYEVTATEIVVWSVGHARQWSQPWRRRMAP
jgi:plasmid stabilization system protein ParE